MYLTAHVIKIAEKSAILSRFISPIIVRLYRDFIAENDDFCRFFRDIITKTADFFTQKIAIKWRLNRLKLRLFFFSQFLISPQKSLFRRSDDLNKRKNNI
jgi:hypothetical protein